VLHNIHDPLTAVIKPPGLLASRPQSSNVRNSLVAVKRSWILLPARLKEENIDLDNFNKPRNSGRGTT